MPNNNSTTAPDSFVLDCLRFAGDDVADLVETWLYCGWTGAEVVDVLRHDARFRVDLDAIDAAYRADAALLADETASYLSIPRQRLA